MTFQYPKEVLEQQALVKQELKKLARMRTDHLIATGQMPATYSSEQAAAAAKNARFKRLAEQSELSAQ